MTANQTPSDYHLIVTEGRLTIRIDGLSGAIDSEIVHPLVVVKRFGTGYMVLTRSSPTIEAGTLMYHQVGEQILINRFNRRSDWPARILSGVAGAIIGASYGASTNPQRVR